MEREGRQGKESGNKRKGLGTDGWEEENDGKVGGEGKEATSKWMGKDRRVKGREKSGE